MLRHPQSLVDQEALTPNDWECLLRRLAPMDRERLIARACSLKTARIASDLPVLRD